MIGVVVSLYRLELRDCRVLVPGMLQGGRGNGVLSSYVL